MNKSDSFREPHIYCQLCLDPELYSVGNKALNPMNRLFFFFLIACNQQRNWEHFVSWEIATVRWHFLYASYPTKVGIQCISQISAVIMLCNKQHPPPPSHLCSSYLFAMETLEHLLLGLGFHPRPGTLSLWIIFPSGVLLWKWAKWSWCWEHVGVFIFNVLGNAPAEAGPGSFVPCPRNAFHGGQLGGAVPYLKLGSPWGSAGSKWPLLSSARPRVALGPPEKQGE